MTATTLMMIEDVDAVDATARERALDVTHSFLVQAPAGSGKTELLIQRFLALLARVDRPERIVAMTFTRKAAGEMRERIVACALGCRRSASRWNRRRRGERARSRCAALRPGCAPRLAADGASARLAVQTIDAFCAGIARQAPLATRLGASPRFVDHAQSLYEAAVRTALAKAPPEDMAWRRLLRHLDNDARRAVRVLSALLAKRAPLLRELASANDEALRDCARGRPGRRDSRRAPHDRGRVPGAARDGVAAVVAPRGAERGRGGACGTACCAARRLCGSRRPAAADRRRAGSLELARVVAARGERSPFPRANGRQRRFPTQGNGAGRCATRGTRRCDERGARRARGRSRPCRTARCRAAPPAAALRRRRLGRRRRAQGRAAAARGRTHARRSATRARSISCRARSRRSMRWGATSRRRICCSSSTRGSSIC